MMQVRMFRTQVHKTSTNHKIIVEFISTPNHRNHLIHRLSTVMAKITISARGTSITVMTIQSRPI